MTPREEQEDALRQRVRELLAQLRETMANGGISLITWSAFVGSPTGKAVMDAALARQVEEMRTGLGLASIATAEAFRRLADQLATPALNPAEFEKLMRRPNRGPQGDIEPWKRRGRKGRR